MVPGGTVTGTLTAEPVLPTVTTPFCSLAVTVGDEAAWIGAQASCSARVAPMPPSVSCS